MGRFTYYCASYWHRFNEPSSVAVVLAPSVADKIRRYLSIKDLRKAIDAAMAEEREYCFNSDCDCDYENHPDTAGCPICKPDLCWSGVHAESARNLFDAKELFAHRRELLAGQVVWLERG